MSWCVILHIMAKETHLEAKNSFVILPAGMANQFPAFLSSIMLVYLFDFPLELQPTNYLWLAIKKFTFYELYWLNSNCFSQGSDKAQKSEKVSS